MEVKEKKAEIIIKSMKYDCRELKGADKLTLEELSAFKPTEYIEDSCVGVLRLIGERTAIVYNENEKSGMEGTRSIISFVAEDVKSLKIMRSGTVRTVFELSPGKQSKAKYETSFFNFSMLLNTIEVSNTVTENGGELFIDYILEIPFTQNERTLMTLTVTPCADEYPLH